MGKKCPTPDVASVNFTVFSSLLCMSMCTTGDESTDLHIPREGKIIPRLKSLLNNIYQLFFLWHSLFKGSEN